MAGAHRLKNKILPDLTQPSLKYSVISNITSRNFQTVQMFNLPQHVYILIPQRNFFMSL